MKELRCPNCSSFDLEYKNGLYNCKSCGGKYIPDEDEEPRKSEEDKFVDKLLKKFKKRDRYEDYSDSNIERWLECTDDIDILIEEIFEINNMNPYAWAIRMLRLIEDGLKSSYQAERVIDDAENALETPKKDIKNILDVIYVNFVAYKEKLVELDPQLEARANAVEAKIQERRK